MRRTVRLKQPRPLSLLLLALAACVPATPPPNLDATPGAAVVVSDGRYESDSFSARYPDDWRAITSPAGEPQFVILAAPDNCTVVILSLDERPAPEPAGCEASDWREANDTSDGTPTVYAAVRAASDAWPAAEATFESIVASITTGD
jgi:hypothetical protein